MLSDALVVYILIRFEVFNRKVSWSHEKTSLIMGMQILHVVTGAAVLGLCYSFIFGTLSVILHVGKV